MNTLRTLSLVALVGAATTAMAQTPAPATPGNGATSNPSAASSPAQRDTISSTAAESPATDSASGPAAASTPLQRETVAGDTNQHTDMKKSETGESGKMMGHSSSASFVTKVAQDGMTEVELGKLALAKSSDDKVRAFAQQMVQDHGKVIDELGAIAKRTSFDVPTELDSEHEAMVEAMNAKTGAAFDAAYAQHMVKDHAKAVALFERTAASGDGELASFAKKTLPTLQEHKKMADSLESSTQVATASDGAVQKE